MRWKTFFSLLFLCLLTFNVDGQSTLRLMSYNIRHGAGLDERLDFDRIAEVINREHPDVVALQEVDSVTQRIGGRDLLGLTEESMVSVCCAVGNRCRSVRYLYLEGRNPVYCCWRNSRGIFSAVRICR